MGREERLMVMRNKERDKERQRERERHTERQREQAGRNHSKSKLDLP